MRNIEGSEKEYNNPAATNPLTMLARFMTGAGIQDPVNYLIKSTAAAKRALAGCPAAATPAPECRDEALEVAEAIRPLHNATLTDEQARIVGTIGLAPDLFPTANPQGPEAPAE